MLDFFQENKECIKIYTGKETIEDPFEKNVSVSLSNGIPIDALVGDDLISSQIQWKIPGINTANAKEIYIEKRNRSLLEQSQKIKIRGQYYEGWRVNGRMQIREEGDLLRVYVYSTYNND